MKIRTRIRVENLYETCHIKSPVSWKTYISRYKTNYISFMKTQACLDYRKQKYMRYKSQVKNRFEREREKSQTPGEGL